ncbi:hypothetical protein [Paraburkholderia sp. SIMBA_053]|uniref:hypothetical protein n=1 Tax=Paraburkholderia sp. SIMBA_053 TaxID=3085794 RepID=UPI00397849D4
MHGDAHVLALACQCRRQCLLEEYTARQHHYGQIPLLATDHRDGGEQQCDRHGDATRTHQRANGKRFIRGHTGHFEPQAQNRTGEKANRIQLAEVTELARPAELANQYDRNEVRGLTEHNARDANDRMLYIDDHLLFGVRF